MFINRITNQNFCSNFILRIWIFRNVKNTFTDSLTSLFYSSMDEREKKFKKEKGNEK